jgi:S-formylglutathione hydrolase FrmB
VTLFALTAILVAVTTVVVLGFGGVDTRGARVVHFTIHSSLTHRTLSETAVIPASDTVGRRPLLVFLHGKGEDENSNINDAMFTALASLGSRAPDIVFPDGSEDSYWHDRADGAWGSYVMHEVIPRTVRLLHADPKRIAIGGLSMGGFGAYDLALLHPGSFCAVGGDSAALWLTGGESAAGAFDNGEDFARNNVVYMTEASADPYPGARLWIDVGNEDPFRTADTTLVRTLRSKGIDVSFHIWPGGHEQSYWQSHWDSYLDFYANALSHCG